MTIKLIPESHTDHNLTALQLLWVLSQDAAEGSIDVQTLVLPESLGTLPCALYGPVMGDEPVPDEDTIMMVRGDRKGKSRLMAGRMAGRVRQTRLITIVSGPGPDTEDGPQPCVLYTSYGGMNAPREPFEDDSDEAKEFWAVHALCE